MAKGGKRPGAGRPKGSLNKQTAALKDAILAAAEKSGDDTGEGGMVGYLTWLSKEEAPSFASLLKGVLPLQVTGENDGPIKVVIQGSDAGLL